MKGLVLTCGAVLAVNVSAQQPLPPACDPAKKEGYVVRGTVTKWCEGIYKSKVTDLVPKLEGFTQPTGVDYQALQTLDTLVVEWSAPPGLEVHLVARYREGKFYQMDALAVTGADGKGQWRWPVGILKNELQKWPIPVAPVAPEAEVRVLASAKLKGDSISIPIRIRSRSGTPVPSRKYQLRMFVEEPVDASLPVVTRFDSVKNRIDTLTMDPCGPIRGGRAGGSLIRVPLCMPASASTGLYQFSLSTSSNGMSTRQLLKIPFYYVAPPSSP